MGRTSPHFPTYEAASALLDKTVAFAVKVEHLILRAHQTRPLGAVAYLTLVAERRLAVAVAALGQERAYEGRVLIRAMLEQYFNLRWIRVRAPHRRANRFMKYLTLERLRILESLPASEKRPFRDTIAKLRKRRTKHRHLFRAINSRGKRQWQTSWADTPSFKARVSEVLTADGGNPDPITSFSYTLYRWFSAALHGNVLHLSQLVENTQSGIRPKAQPETNPEAIPAGAAVLLYGTLEQASRVLGFSIGMKEELRQLQTEFSAFIAAYSDDKPAAPVGTNGSVGSGK